MSIKREDLDARRIDLADVTTGKRLALIHPGKILRDDFLLPMKISVYTLAQAIKVPRSRVNDIVLGRRGITADTAFRLAQPFNQIWPDRHSAGVRSVEVWSNIVWRQMCQISHTQIWSAMLDRIAVDDSGLVRH